jgi:hypothetical protein
MVGGEQRLVTALVGGDGNADDSLERFDRIRDSGEFLTESRGQEDAEFHVGRFR